MLPRQDRLRVAGRNLVARSKGSIETLVVHAGNPEGPESVRPTSPPIHPSTSFRAETPEEQDAILGGTVPGYTYARHGNPTVNALAAAMRELEEADVAITTASGMAAVDAAFFAAGVQAGDVLLLSQDLYGASLNLAENIWTAGGVRTATVDMTNLAAVEQALKEWRPRALLFETLSNPILKVANIPEVVRLAREFDCRVIVDNTFATPLMVRPITLGVDIVVHSATKYLGGHGDAMAGVVAAREQYRAPLQQYLKLRGAVTGPFEAWLIHRGIKTLAVRFERQCANAVTVARALASAGVFRKVYHPLLADHPTHQEAVRLFGGTLGGAVVTLELDGGRPEVYRFLQGLRLVGSATTIGDVYTLCLYPRMASHRNQSPEMLEAMGITDGTVRIAVGIESPDDIVDDVLRAARLAGAPVSR